VTIRGIERQKVFYDDNDHDIFLDRLMESGRLLLNYWFNEKENSGNGVKLE
jgi:hypothetical protein